MLTDFHKNEAKKKCKKQTKQAYEATEPKHKFTVWQLYGCMQKKRREQQSQVYEAAFARTIGQKSDFCIIGSFFLFTHNIEIQRLNQNSTTIK